MTVRSICNDDGRCSLLRRQQESGECGVLQRGTPRRSTVAWVLWCSASEKNHSLAMLDLNSIRARDLSGRENPDVLAYDPGLKALSTQYRSGSESVSLGRVDDCAGTAPAARNDSGDDEEARRSLVRVGLDHAIGILHKGMPAWIDAGLEFTRTMQLSNERGCRA